MFAIFFAYCCTFAAELDNNAVSKPYYNQLKLKRQ